MHFKIAVVTLNQWALDFDGNTKRIIESILEAHKSGAIYRVGPELEISGYSVEDGFYDDDTVFHCWTSLSEILEQTKDLDLVIDIGMPVYFNSLYNCRVICLRGRILFIRAKTSLAREGIYREHRYFNAWPTNVGPVPFRLPACMTSEGARYVPFGANFAFDLHDSNFGSTMRIGWEICQELWDIKHTSSEMYGDFGCHLVVNSSGSYWELRKLNNINTMIQGISLRAGACYAYSNLVGCDGQRFVFYGKSCIYDRGNLIEMMQVDPDHLFRDSHVIYHDIDPREIDEHKAQLGIRSWTGSAPSQLVWNLLEGALECHKIDNSYKVFALDLRKSTGRSDSVDRSKSGPTSSLVDGVARLGLTTGIRFEHEINCYVPLWLWDYLRRSYMRGFMVPLSGGLDSCSVAVLVYSLCTHLHRMMMDANNVVLAYFGNLLVLSPKKLLEKLATPAHICGLLLKCCYLSTRFSSQATESRARRLCESIGASFSVVSIDEIYAECRKRQQTNPPPDKAGLLDQNLQARLRMTMTYYMSGGDRIVLATGNVDEAIMGYLTKYDCSSADINPIGGLCKEDLKSYLQYCCSDLFKDHKDLVDVLHEIIEAPPSAELTGPEQRDEDEMGLTYNEISVLGKVRRGIYGCCGPRGAFKKIWHNRKKPPFSTKIRCLRDSEEDPELASYELGKLIKRFYGRYVRNRHKLTVLTPALHAETYSPDDNRFDHRQILFPPMFRQFDCIDRMVRSIKEHGFIGADCG